MKAVYMEKPWNIEISDVQMPKPKEGEALLRVKSAGICGSDIGAFRGTNGLVSYPRIIGHEIAGEVISISENNKNGIKPGDRVIVDPYLYCGHCYPCSIGRTNCCVDLKVLGVHVDGGMAEYFCHPADMLLKGPDGLFVAINATDEGLTSEQLSQAEYQNAISGTVLVARSVTADKIAAKSITANEIAAGAITTAELAAESVDASKIKAGSITTSHVAANFGETLDISSNKQVEIIAGNVQQAQETADSAQEAAEQAAPYISATPPETAESASTSG